MKKIFLALSVTTAIYAQTIPELFNALKSHSQTKSDEMAVKKAEVFNEVVYSQLYPKIDLFATYDNYSSPTSMLPVPPDILVHLVQNPAKPAQPFSYNIYKAGAKFSMPIYVKSIYTTAKKAKALQESAKAKKHINLLTNEAIIVGANANMAYLDALQKALNLKEKSLLETKKTVQIKVDNGRSPASTLYKINDGLNQISIARNNIDIQKKKITSTIQSLTGMIINKPINMEQIATYKDGVLASLQPVREKIRADRLGIEVEKEKLYPTLVARGNYAYSRGLAYNNHDNVNEEYGNIGVVLNIPIFDKSQSSEIKLAKIELKSNEIKLQKLTDELNAKAKMLKESLPLLDNSKRLYEKSVKDKKELLKIAKVNFNVGRLSTEEYLRYEDDVVSAEANLYKTEASKWETLMQLAVIYANNIEEIVK